MQQPYEKQQRISGSSSSCKAAVVEEARDSLRQLAPAEQQLACISQLPLMLDKCSRALQDKVNGTYAVYRNRHEELTVCINALRIHISSSSSSGLAGLQVKLQRVKSAVARKSPFLPQPFNPYSTLT